MNYTGIAEIGNEMVRLLQEKMVPEALENRDHVGMCSPEEHGDYEVGIFLYDIKESPEVRINTMGTVNSTRMQKAPTALDLHYMITAYSNSDLAYRAEAEQRLLGKVIQVFYDNQVMEKFADRMTGYVPVIRMENDLSMDDKGKIWSAPNKGYKTSLYYKVGPVMISSTESMQTSRVREGSFTVQEA